MMAGRADRPLVFLDVDGPLIPFRARPVRRRPSSRDGVGSSSDASGNPLVDRLDPADGRRLLELGCQIVWATTWMAEANEVISPRLGLPELPIVDFPDVDDEPDRGLHWKTTFLTRWAAGRAFVWIDDETTDADRRWVMSNHPGRALVHRVDPFVGLTDADFSSIRRWLADCRPA
jgi:HAD domain in Swiss Army Knife RNA repair proteins